MAAGVGRVQGWGGPVEEIRPGDVVRIPPNHKHWHGASANTAMTHLAITESLNGKVVDWMEKVTDEQLQMGLEPELQRFLRFVLDVAAGRREGVAARAAVSPKR